MFISIKEVIRIFKVYKEENYEKLFSVSEYINKYIGSIKILIKEKYKVYMFIIILLNLYILYKNIQGPFLIVVQIIVFIILLSMVIEPINDTYYGVTNVIKKRIGEDNINIKKVIRIISVGFIMLNTVIVLFGQSLFIKYYLNPPLESCTHYDWYGNVLFKSKDIGYCPELQNLEVTKEGNNTKISFGVEYTYDELIYEKYLYQYENSKLVKREVKYYNLEHYFKKFIDAKELEVSPLSKVSKYIFNMYRINTTHEELICKKWDDAYYDCSNVGWLNPFNSINEMGYNPEDLGMQPIKIETIYNTYKEDEFISKRYTSIKEKDDRVEIVHSRKVGNEVIISYPEVSNKYDVILTNNSGQFNNDYMNIIIWDSDKSHISTSINAIYGNYFTNIKSTNYYFISDYNVNLSDLDNIYQIHSYRNTKYTFQFRNDKLNQIKHLEHNDYRNPKLLYRNIISEEDYGFKVEHYSYHRDRYGRYYHPEVINNYRRGNEACYVGYSVEINEYNNYIINDNYRYLLTTLYDADVCQIDLFNNINPVLLDY